MTGDWIPGQTALLYHQHITSCARPLRSHIWSMTKGGVFDDRRVILTRAIYKRMCRNRNSNYRIWYSMFRVPGGLP